MVENVRCCTFKTSKYKDVLANLITFEMNNHTHGDNNTKFVNPEQTLIFRHEGLYVNVLTSMRT